MAVKIIDVQGQKEKETKEGLKTEVELLANLSHAFAGVGNWKTDRNIHVCCRWVSTRPFGTGEAKPDQDDKGTDHRRISALHYLHGRNIIHRDIKPENILYKDLHTNPTFSLADFGFSKVIDSNTTFVGTPLYLAPEVCSGASQDFRLDIWSFGVVIYEMLTGLALDQLPALTNRICMSGEWCKRLEKACRNGGDLAKMVTLSVERRVTIDSCYASDTFPVLPNTLPYPVTETPAPTPPASTRRIPKTKQRVQKNANIFATPAKFPVEKAQQALRRLPDKS